ncbi:hypothetical protein GIB67_010565 [Kingdonia uniflora]|uniref:Uncharacterized protein n=1 Tax=Kingdonia uniflora TaxID=39325 RepID=A0A7J7MAS5_9MAGN|nr:hypothetical protein GIB67_010565 [Kingdonia uniflora]
MRIPINFKQRSLLLLLFFVLISKEIKKEKSKIFLLEEEYEFRHKSIKIITLT